MTTWFTSDEHYGHRNIIAYSGRPFAHVHDMQEGLIARHNARVQHGDLVIHVGDFAMDARLVPAVLPRLRGRHVLVSGNHDRCHPCRKGWEKSRRDYLLWGFESVVENLVVDGMLVHHMPYRGDSGEKERFAQYRPKDEGKILLHGHVHEKWRRRGRMVNVGVDKWNWAPVSLEEVKAFIESGIEDPIKG
jgi:calcineurin-like phosphoesterase family protein